jgi:hypothetical protein
VPDALRDGMELITLEGYTEREKVVAFRYLVPRQITGSGLVGGEDIDGAGHMPGGNKGPHPTGACLISRSGIPEADNARSRGE